MLASSKICCALSHTTAVCRLALPQLPSKSEDAEVNLTSSKASVQ